MATQKYVTFTCYNKKCRKGQMLDLSAYLSGERMRCSCGMQYEFDGQKFRPVIHRRGQAADVVKKPD